MVRPFCGVRGEPGVGTGEWGPILSDIASNAHVARLLKWRDLWGGTADEPGLLEATWEGPQTRVLGLRSTTAVRTCRALALSVEERAERKRAVRL